MEQNKNINTGSINTNGGSIHFGDVFNDLSIAYNHAYKELVSQIEIFIQTFRPKSALELLNDLESNIATKEKIDEKIKNNILFLKVTCESMLDPNSEEVSKAFIRAYNCDKENFELKEIACFRQYKLREFAKAKDLANEILELDEYNPVAWAVKTLVIDSSSLKFVLEKVPATVYNDQNFKRIIYYSSIDKKTYTDLTEVLQENALLLFPSDYDGTSLTYQNYKQRLFLIQSCISKLSLNVLISFNQREIYNRDEVELINSILLDFTNCIKDTELESEFLNIFFFKQYCEYLLNGTKVYVDQMFHFYKILKQKGELTLLLMANSLQQIDDFDNAIQIIEESKEKTSQMLDLELFCLLKKGDKEQFNTRCREKLELTTDINSSNILMLSGLLETLADFNLLAEYSLDNFLESKSFEFEYLKEYLKELYKIYSDSFDDSTIPTLAKISPEIFARNVELLPYLSLCFYNLGEFSKANEVFDKFIDGNVETPDLPFYIDSLYQSKENHEKLLFLLEKWRLDFSFNESLLRLEISLRIKLFDWESSLKCCELFLTKNLKDEFVLTNFAITISEIEEENKSLLWDSLIEKLSGFEFKIYSNASNVSSILISNDFQLKALEIIYPWALDKSNAQARLDFFNACIRVPKGTLEEYELVEIGRFVKYQTSDELNHFIQVVEGHEFTSALLGKKVNETIEIQSKYGKKTSSVVIKRIMNKFLSLHDEILNEVEKNPFSEIPMEAFDASEYMGGEKSIIDFFKEIAGNGSAQDPDINFEKYYKHELCFSELIISEFNSNYVRGFYNVKFDRKGITQINPSLYQNYSPNSENEYILDFSSILAFYEAHKKFGLVFNAKLVVNKSILSILNTYSRDFIFYSGNGYELNKEFYTDLKNWIKANCELKTSISILEKDKLPRIATNNQLFENYIFDVISLFNESPTSVLITDDAIFSRAIPINSGRIISTNLFLIKNILITN